MRRVTLAVVVSFLTQSFAGFADAAIELHSSVPDLRTGQLERQDDPIFLIQEQTLTLARDLIVDGTPSSPMGKSAGGTIAAGTQVTSWLLHFDMFGAAQVNMTASGAYDFGATILGLIFTATRLDSTDSLLGNPGTVYAHGKGYRGSNDSSTPTDVWTHPNVTTIDIAGLQNQGVGLDEIRVITAEKFVHNPEPKGAAIWVLLCASVAAVMWLRRKQAVGSTGRGEFAWFDLGSVREC
jgi:hypothetical protein